MSETTHTRSTHIDAPVEQVFDYVKDPQNFYAAMSEVPGSRATGHVTSELTDVRMAPDGGVGSSWSFKGAVFVFHFDATLTREEYIANQRIVDSNRSAGATWTCTFEPDESGTTFGLGFTMSTKLPLIDKAADWLSWDANRDLDAMLEAWKQAIEA
jgi:hypothetical protein